MRTRARWWAALALATLPFVAAGHVDAPPLRPLKGVEELKAWFNANRAHPRLILLLSPT